MNGISRVCVGGLCAAAAGVCMAAGPAPAYVAPRLADGVTPDLRGIWQVRDTAYLNIEGHAAMGGVAASASIVMDTPDRKIPYRAEAVAARLANARNLVADPAVKCYEAGIPRATYLPSPFQIAQSNGPNGATAFVYQDNHSFRMLYPASRPHLDGIDWWMGDSRFRAEANTLVVDDTTFNDQSWLDASGNNHSDALHVVERYTRTGADTIDYTARIEDPKTFTRPWTLHETLYRDTRPSAHIAEDECLDDRNGVRHRIAPTDPRNLQINRYDRWTVAQHLGLLTSGTDISTPPGQVPGESSGSPPNRPTPTGAVPRLADGHPDVNGIWRSSPDVGPPPPGTKSNGPPPGLLPGSAANPIMSRKRGDDASRDFAFAGVPRLPYTMGGLQEQMWRSAHEFLDGEPRCHVTGVPRAITQPPYPQQLIQDGRSLTILYENVHELRTVPIGGSAHPRGYSAWDGDSRAHWDGDTLVVDVANFNGRTWMNMNGNFVDDREHAVERYTLVGPDKIDYQITITDPGVFSRPFTLKLPMLRETPDNQILEYACLEGESDRQHYTEDMGGQRQAKQAGSASSPGAPATPTPTPAVAMLGCLRGIEVGNDVTYRLQTGSTVHVPVGADAGLKRTMVKLIDREVMLSGRNEAGVFHAETAQVLSEGCNASLR